ncbi:carbohydrate-binding family 9-like protein [Tundrisphaera lichenicola]|uniref:carbohydrate-binding family 9-like protein n=1 Tax=Tundrisphaera lichenicola TaxID=2029860 RepID=UPI003EBCECDD
MSSNRILCAFAMIACLVLGADNPAPKGYVCGRAKAPIVVDGRLDEESWQLASWTDDFVDIQGDAKPLPRFRTRVKMLWDDHYFYIAAQLDEPHVWGKLTDHDSVIFQDNDFEVFIDPDGDNHEYYEIEINALNTEWDLLLEKPYRDGGPAVNAWEIPGLKTATNVNGTINDPKDIDESWTVEFAFPWKVLAERAHRASPPNAGDQWRVNFSRVEWEHRIEGQTYKKVEGKPEDNWVWSPQGAIDMHRPERFGYVQFSGELPPKDSYHPDPTGPARDRLMAIYRAQREYHAKNKAWAGSLEELSMADLKSGEGESRPVIEATPEGYTATIKLNPTEGRPEQTLIIRADSRLSQQNAKP